MKNVKKNIIIIEKQPKRTKQLKVLLDQFRVYHLWTPHSSLTYPSAPEYSVSVLAVKMWDHTRIRKIRSRITPTISAPKMSTRPYPTRPGRCQDVAHNHDPRHGFSYQPNSFISSIIYKFIDYIKQYTTFNNW